VKISFLKGKQGVEKGCKKKNKKNKKGGKKKKVLEGEGVGKGEKKKR